MLKVMSLGVIHFSHFGFFSPLRKTQGMEIDFTEIEDLREEFFLLRG